MKKVSIKTVDGNRYDYACPNNQQLYTVDGDWIVVQDANVTRMFYRRNVVSVTIKVEEDA